MSTREKIAWALVGMLAPALLTVLVAVSQHVAARFDALEARMEKIEVQSGVQEELDKAEK